MKKEFKTVKIGFLAVSMRMQACICIRRYYAHICRIELESI